ncbi:MAG: DinB family protein [Anaerolineales bacterium]|nr:DinB family protein [Anaerolineales bacterium]MCA9978451.1 DinB family protein [Anaerolineales bacterium]
MLALFADFLERLTELHNGMETAVSGLPPEALDWVPGPEMNSLTVLVAHTAGAERYWIGDVAGQENSHRVRATEFEKTSLSESELKQLLRETLAHSRGVLARLTAADLEREYVSAVHNGRSFRAAWALLHALEHTATHLGHMQLVRQLWQQQMEV